MKPGTQSSAAPSGAAGFTFGSKLEEAATACTQAGKAWNAEEGECSGTPADVGFPATARIRTCEEKVCVIEVTPTVKYGLGQAFLALKETLVKKYGTPRASKRNTVPGECSKSLATCLEDGRASLEFIWDWPGSEKVNLLIRKGLYQDDTVSIQLRYSTPARYVRPNADGL